MLATVLCNIPRRTKTVIAYAFAALLLRFELSPALAAESGFLDSVSSYMLLNTVLTVFIFAVFRLYNSLWEFAGLHELVRIGFASLCSAAEVWLGMLLMGLEVPRSYPFIYLLVIFVAASFPRFVYRMLRSQRAASNRGARKRTMRELSSSASFRAARAPRIR